MVLIINAFYWYRLWQDNHIFWFYTAHALYYKKVGLATTCHKKFCDRVAELARKFFIPLNARNDLLIHTSFAMRVMKTPHTKELSPNNPAQVTEGL